MYNPERSKYHKSNHCFWKIQGQKVRCEYLISKGRLYSSEVHKLKKKLLQVSSEKWVNWNTGLTLLLLPTICPVLNTVPVCPH